MIRRRSASLLAVVLLLTAMPPAAAVAADPALTPHDRVVAHWTEARMRAAQPRDFVRTADGTFKPRAKPGSGAVTGASWPNGKGLVYRATGKVYFEMGGSGWVCSGAVANDGRTGYSLVLTAAHCAYDEVADQWATYWLFVPQYDSAPTFSCGSNAYGCWTASGLVVHNGYASREAFDSQATYFDFAFAIIGPQDGTGRVLDSTVGSFPLAFQPFPRSTPMAAFGYPASGKYHGDDLTWCSGPVFYDPYNASKTYGMDCNMTGGSSGGPWFTAFDATTGTGTLSSLNSYGYSGIRAMHGPWFNDSTRAVYDRANSTTGWSIVP